MEDISRNDVALGERCDNDKYQIITLIKYVICNEWRVLSLKDKKRQGRGSIDKVKNDLLFRSKIYKMFKYKFVPIIERLNEYH
jgi:hypothetical protein